ncbi:hypothetical protein MILUP08_41916 [Micromonospora lupini str. Lupac 08]|uniref:Uncharacterized protein n=1 Tax=Micromonospora lupini str. Lupac 08 TaxID=1150864 RepID=I0KZK1_9ACTN|nr:hypothetical protein MILUP08_41916 [Micromonospora lupini str. Lupac 08]
MVNTDGVSTGPSGGWFQFGQMQSMLCGQFPWPQPPSAAWLVAAEAAGAVASTPTTDAATAMVFHSMVHPLEIDVCEWQ